MCDATVGRWRAHFAKFKLILSEIRLIDYFDERETSRDDSHEDFFLRRLFPLSGNAASWHIFVLIWHEFFKKHSSNPPAILPSQHLA